MKDRIIKITQIRAKHKLLKMRIVQGPQRQHQAFDFRGHRSRREKRVENVSDKIMTRNFPNL